MATTKKDNNLLKFLNSYQAICIALVAIILFMMVLNIYIAHSTSLYTFGGYSDGITILDGSIYIGRDVNHLTAPNIVYSKEEVMLEDYTIGYYIGDEAVSVIKKSSVSDETIGLKAILDTADWSFTETHKGANYLSKKNVKNLNDLNFKISAKDIEGNDISIIIKLDVTKISK